jgi:hypothetical protein
MKDTLSMFLAISVLAIGGTGLYMYRNKNDDSSEDDSSYQNERQLENEEVYENQFNSDENYEEKPKTRRQKNKVNTKKNKKTTGTKRRY